MKIAVDGKSVLMIGGDGTVGKAIARALSNSGATVMHASVRGDADAARVHLDLASAKGAAASAAACVAKFGAPYLLVNVSSAVESGAVGDEVPAEAELERFAFAARAFASSVERIINVISVAGVVPLRGAAAFSARQAALASMTRALAMELAPGVLVNALAVGALDDDPSMTARLASHSPLKRAAAPAEVANAALFLADPANSYTTGHVMAVDGGWSIGYARDF